MQAEALVPLAEKVKELKKHLTVYTGYRYEQLLEKKEPAAERLLALADLLVDGPFLLEERDLTLPYRGSRNQRVIDLEKTRKAGQPVPYRSEYEDL